MNWRHLTDEALDTAFKKHVEQLFVIVATSPTDEAVAKFKKGVENAKEAHDKVTAALSCDMGAVEEAGKVAGGFVDSMKQQPLSLALVVMNICLLGFFYVLLTTVAAQREREIGLLYADKKEVQEMLIKCGAHEKKTEIPWPSTPTSGVPYLQE